MVARSRTHDVLTQEKWEGADLHAIVNQALAPFRDPTNDRFPVHGPGVKLSTRIALDLAVARHELATTATKYGAHRTHLARSISPGHWAAIARRRSFGTRLIERSLPQDLGGEARIEFVPTGVVCSFDTLLAWALGSTDAKIANVPAGAGCQPRIVPPFYFNRILPWLRNRTVPPSFGTIRLRPFRPPCFETYVLSASGCLASHSSVATCMPVLMPNPAVAHGHR
jgi:hypothetical protein